MEDAMTPEQFTTVLGSATPDQLESLDMAHWRYMSLAGIVSGVLPVEVVEADQNTYPHFIKRNGDLAVFSDVDCVAFMVDVTHLSPQLCEAWMSFDDYELHGETADATAARLACQAKDQGMEQQRSGVKP